MSKDKPGLSPSISHKVFAEEGVKPISGPSSDSNMGPIERANLVAHLSLISQRLADVEAQLKSKPLSKGSGTGKTLLELFKILFGGWPAFGLLFMILFYIPIRDAINVIPEKVMSADEIGVMGVSLKNTIRIEAEKVGAFQLSETLPALSPVAVEFLLQGSREYNSLVSYSLNSDDSNLIDAIYLPNEQTLSIIRELKNKKLVAIRLDGDIKDRTVGEIIQAIDEWKKTYPVREDGSSNDPNQVRYVLRTPTKLRPPRVDWRLTDLGKNAVSIILKAVTSQLAPQRLKSKAVRQKP